MKRWSVKLITSLLIAFATISCAKHSEKLDRASRFLEDTPDSTIAILRHLTSADYKRDIDRALYGQLMYQTQYKKFKPMGPDSLIDFSISYYQHHDYDNHLATCYLYKGRQYKRTFQYEKAMNCYLKAMDVITNKQDYLLLGRINSDIGDIHIPQRDYALARKKYITAYDYFIKAGKRKFAFYELLVIGTSYNNAKQFKKAEIFYSRMLPKAKDSLERGDLYQAIGVNYYQYKKLDSALVYFRKCIRFPYFYNARAIRYYYYSDLLFDLHKFDSAFYYAKHSFDFEPDIRTQRECFRIMTNTEFVRGNLKNVSLYMNQYVTLNDSLRKIDSQTKGSYMEKMHSSALDAQQSGFQRWMLVGLLVFVVGTALILYYRMRKRNRLEKQRNEELLIRQKAGIRKELVHKHRDAMLHKIETIKAEQKASRKQATPAEKEELDRRLYEEVLHLNNADFFYREMDAVLNNLVDKLKTRYPALTSKEITWCCLNLLHVPTADILLLLDYKVDSLNKMKQRLAQKVGVEGVTALDTFLNNLLTEE